MRSASPSLIGAQNQRVGRMEWHRERHRPARGRSDTRRLRGARPSILSSAQHPGQRGSHVSPSSHLLQVRKDDGGTTQKGGESPLLQVRKDDGGQAQNGGESPLLQVLQEDGGQTQEGEKSEHDRSVS